MSVGVPTTAMLFLMKYEASNEYSVDEKLVSYQVY